MADFCRQCSIDILGEDFGDMKGITKASVWEEGLACVVLCEGCGTIQVDPEGNCVTVGCLKKHNEKSPFHKIEQRPPNCS